MKTEKINLKEVVVLDLMEQPIVLPTNYQRDLGNAMYIGNNGIEQADLGKKIFYSAKNEIDLELTREEIELFISLIDAFPWLGKPLHNGIKDYLTDKLENFKENKYGNKNNQAG